MPKNENHPSPSDRFDQPDAVRVFFDHSVLPLELIQRLKKTKQKFIILEIPPDHPIVQSVPALQWLALQFQKIDTHILVDIDDEDAAGNLQEAGLELWQRTRDSKGTTGSMSKKDEALHRFFNEPAVSGNQDIFMQRSTISRRARGTRFPCTPFAWAAGGVAVIGIFLFTAVLPQAHVIVIPETSQETKVKSVSLQASWSDPQKNVLHIRGKKLEARTFVESTSQITQTSPMGEPAHGTLRITNQTGQEVNLPVLSLLTGSDGVEYELSEAGVVPPATVLQDNTVKFGTLRVGVRAKERGAKANRGEGMLTIQAIPAHRRNRVFAEIVEPIAGGKDEIGKVVREEDVIAARDMLARELEEKFTVSLREQLTTDWIIDALLRTATITEEIVIPSVGTVSDDFSVRLEGMTQGIAFMREDAQRAFGLDAAACDDAQGNPRFCAITVSKKGDLKIDEGMADAEITLHRTKFPDFSFDDMKSQIKGLPIADARRTILAIPGVKDVRINNRLSVRDFLPRETEKIFISVEK